VKKRYYSLIISIIVIALGIIQSSGAVSHTKTKNTASVKDVIRVEISTSTLYQITKVTDGDTVHVKVDSEEITVRMKGVDTPETVDPRKTVQCFGKEASNKNKELLEGRMVTLVPDKGDKSLYDKYGRVLAYIYRDDGLFINEYLIEEGYAHEYTYGKTYEMQNVFKKLEKQAREEKRGLWGEVCVK
jgi:micrococcal nuclease